jgi:23S rRNA pseudouridine1911/1915/1917 synthase
LTHPLSIIVTAEDTRKRLDHFLVEQGLPYSRSRLKKWIEEGRITVNGRREKGGYRLKIGDRLLIEPEADPVSMPLIPEEIPLTVCFEDRDLLVLEKPAGLVVHPAAGNYRGTLVHALLHHCRDLSGIGGVYRPGIVHRLDKDTSGLMVVAKNDAAHQHLVRQFQQGRVIKEYQALVWGVPTAPSGRIARPIGRHPRQRKKMAVDAPRGKEAVTEWRVLERFPQGISWLKLILKTGRTHQIRVHLSFLGWPVVGDPLYGGTKQIRPLTRSFPGLKEVTVTRQLLHASRLAFFHPTNENFLDFSSVLPEDMQSLLRFLRQGT